MGSHFKASRSPQARRAESRHARERHPRHLPVVCEARDGAPVPGLDKFRFLVPSATTAQQFADRVRNRAALSAKEAIFRVGRGPAAFVPRAGCTMAELHARHSDADGFLYVRFAVGGGASASEYEPSLPCRGRLRSPNRLLHEPVWWVAATLVAVFSLLATCLALRVVVPPAMRAPATSVLGAPLMFQ